MDRSISRRHRNQARTRLFPQRSPCAHLDALHKFQRSNFAGHRRRRFPLLRALDPRACATRGSRARHEPSPASRAGAREHPLPASRGEGKGTARAENSPGGVHGTRRSITEPERTIAPPGSRTGQAHDRTTGERLAAFDSPLEVARGVREKFGISITRNSIRRYDPTRHPECAARWKELFYAARHAMLRNKGQAAALDPRCACAVARARRCVLRRPCGRHAGAAVAADQRRLTAAVRATARGAAAHRRGERTRAILALLAKTQMLGEETGPSSPA